MLAFICYIEVNFIFVLVDCVHYSEDFIKLRFGSVHFTVIFTGLKKIFCYTEDFVI